MVDYLKYKSFNSPIHQRQAKIIYMNIKESSRSTLHVKNTGQKENRYVLAMSGIEGTIIALKLVQVDTYERDQYICRRLSGITPLIYYSQ